MNAREIQNESDLLAIKGLAHLYIPKQEWAWWPGMRPHVLCSVEQWPGYHETLRVDVRLPCLLEDALLCNGWTRKGFQYWWEYTPPERGTGGPAS